MLKQLLSNLFNQKTSSTSKSLRALSPEEIGVQLNKALNLHQSGQYEKAIELYEEIIGNDANHVDALHLLGLVKHLQNKNNEAILLLEKVLNINPYFTGAQVNLAVMLRSVFRYDEALIFLNKALSSEPNHLEAIFNRGNLLLDMGEPLEAIKNFDQYLNITKNNPDVFSSKAIALFALGRHEESLLCYDSSIELNKNIAKYYFGKGNVLRELQRYHEAIQSYEQARLLKPDDAGAHQNEGLTRLLVGDYALGWPQYEWRWSAELAAIKPTFTQPCWDGKQTLENKKILLIAEQGFGDTIQFSRYINKVVELGATVYLLVPKPLLSLFDRANGIAKVCIEGEALPVFDYYYPLMSLPLAFQTTVGSIPLPDVVFTIDSTTTDYWIDKTNILPLPRVGVFWRGTTPQRANANHPIDAMVKTNLALRNLLLTEFSAIFRSGISFVSIQKEMLPEEVEQLKQYNHVYDMSAYIDNFSDTAALIEQLDLVITIDTAVAHLAGTMGKPVWILLPFNADWRWLVNRDDSPWYPSARLFRQRVRDSWSDVLEEVGQALSSTFE